MKLITLGLTWNPPTRWEQHLSLFGSRYTKEHKPKKLVYLEEHDNLEEARKREIANKRLELGKEKETYKMENGIRNGKVLDFARTIIPNITAFCRGAANRQRRSANKCRKFFCAIGALFFYLFLYQPNIFSCRAPDRIGADNTA